MTEFLPIEIDASEYLNAAAFSASGEYLLSSGPSVRVWRVQDGQRIAAIAAKGVFCLAMSKNGRWMAGGTYQGEVFVLDAKTYERVWTCKAGHQAIHAVDFSADSTRFVSGSLDRTATVWNVASGEKVFTLHHEREVIAAKFSPDGDRIATATFDGSVHVWDKSGRLLVDIPTKVTPLFNNGLLWSKNSIFVVSGDRISQLDTVAGSQVSEWQVPKGDDYSSIALPKHGKFITYSAGCTITSWDTTTHLQLGLVECGDKIRAITLSPSNKLLATAGQNGKIIIRSLARGAHPFVFRSPHPTLQDLHFQIDHAVLDAWEHDRLIHAEVLLTTAICESPDLNHHLLAARALVRTRLARFDEALVDANTAITVQPSIIAYITKSLSHAAKGEKVMAYRTYDIAFEHSHPTHVTLLLVLKAIIVFMSGDHHDAISRLDDLIAIIPFNSLLCTIQAYMYLLWGNDRMESQDYEGAIEAFQLARARALHDCYPPLLAVSLMFGWRFDDLHIIVRRRLCEALWAAGRRSDAGESLLEMVNTYEEEVYMSEPHTKWVSSFTEQCLSAPESADGTTRRDSNMAAISAATLLLREWAKAKLAHGLWSDALGSAASFIVSRFMIFRVMCEHLETYDRLMDASECFRYMLNDFVDQKNIFDEQAEWVIDFKHRCVEKLEDLGDVAMFNKQHDGAISYYSAALPLSPASGLLLKRSKAYLANGLYAEALSDANKVVEVDPTSPWGYEKKHAALHQAGRYEAAVHAFEMMLSLMAQSSNPEIHALHRNYVYPAKTRTTIQRAVLSAIRDSPRVLINTRSGQLCNKAQRAATFESLPIFHYLVSSMTTDIDDARIQHEVTDYYRYGMFSHKWEDNEPLFGQVMRVVVHDLEESPTHDKLKMFCKIVQDAGLHWAWSDTCCINRADHFVLQEALVSMFKWYQNSALTVVFLFDVPFPSRRGDLTRSIWNSRAWTFQEYHASKVVRFYTQDWRLYLNLDTPNHKESLDIISEMEEATGVSARVLTAIRPSLDDIREKLCLASTRETTLVEDAAYSLLGIFSMSLPIVYGEGDHALGRLLARLLTNSGDATILAWTGKSGSFNSCLPTSITVFKRLSATHIPRGIASTDMDQIICKLRESLPSLTSAVGLYDRLSGPEFRVASFLDQRMRLPCLVFKVGLVTRAHDARGQVFRASTDAFGIVEIRTEEDISRFDPLYLAHPWINYLLDRQSAAGGIETMLEENTDDAPLLGASLSLAGPPGILALAPKTQADWFASHFWLTLGRWSATSLVEPASPPQPTLLTNKEMRALRVVARLTQPFGALLLTPNRGKIAAYKRVSAETLIMVKLEEITLALLDKLVSSAHVLDVL